MAEPTRIAGLDHKKPWEYRFSPTTIDPATDPLGFFGSAFNQHRVSPRGWFPVDPRLQCLQRENRKLADDFEKTKGKALDDAG